MRTFPGKLIGVLAGICAAALAAPPIDPGYFAPTTRITGLLYPNPENATCWVVMGIKQTSTSPPIRQQPTATQVPSAVEGNVTLQVENLEDYTFEYGFNLTVEIPLDAIISSITTANSTLGIPKAGHNSTVAYSILTSQPLAASGWSSTFVNTTVVARTQDFAPRSIYLNGTRCALAFQGLKPLDLPPATNLAPALAPVLAALPPTELMG